MKTFITISLIIAFSLTASAQSHSIGIKIAGAHTSVSSNVVPDITYREGIFAGLTYDYISKKHLNFGIEFLSEQRGYRVELIFTDQFGNPTGQVEYVTFSCDYFSAPIKFGYVLGNKIFATISVGAIPALLQKGVVSIPNFDSNNNVIGYDENDITDNLTSFDFAAFGEAGAGIKLLNKFSILAAFRYQKSFTSITNDNNTNYVRNTGMSVSLGIRYVFNSAEE